MANTGGRVRPLVGLAHWWGSSQRLFQSWGQRTGPVDPWQLLKTILPVVVSFKALSHCCCKDWWMDKHPTLLFYVDTSIFGSIQIFLHMIGQTPTNAPKMCSNKEIMLLSFSSGWMEFKLATLEFVKNECELYKSEFSRQCSAGEIFSLWHQYQFTVLALQGPISRA